MLWRGSQTTAEQIPTNTFVITKTYRTSVPTTQTPSDHGSLVLQTKAWLTEMELDLAGQGKHR